MQQLGGSRKQRRQSPRGGASAKTEPRYRRHPRDPHHTTHRMHPLALNSSHKRR